MVQRLARSPFKAKIRVRFPLALPKSLLMFSVFPSREQWKGWSLPSKLTALSLYTGVSLALIGLLYTYLLSRPQLPPEEVLRSDTLENLDILGRKLAIADDLYQRMREAENSNAPNPYLRIADRMRRDLPPFNLAREVAIEDGNASQREPFKTYVKIYGLLKNIEKSEQQTILLFHRAAEGYYDIQVQGLGVTDIRGIAFYGLQFHDLEGNYLMGFGMIQDYLKQVGVEESPDLPKNLFILKELIDKRGGAQKTQ
jgi:hypothetical protein